MAQSSAAGQAPAFHQVACVLVLYGGFLVAGQILVVTGVIEAEDPDWAAIYGHLFLWDPWFLLWGLLLLVVAIAASRAVPRSPWGGDEQSLVMTSKVP